MKKILVIGLCFVLISCFKEPKKANEISATINSSVVTVPTTSSNAKNADSLTASNPLSSMPANETEENQNGKMTVKLLEKIVEMPTGSFKDWASKNNYIYDKISSREYFDVIYYKKENTNHIQFVVSRDGENFGIVVFETSIQSEYSNIKKNCTSLGYTFINSENHQEEVDKNAIFDVYRSNTHELDFYLPRRENTLGYSISIKKIVK